MTTERVSRRPSNPWLVGWVLLSAALSRCAGGTPLCWDFVERAYAREAREIFDRKAGTAGAVPAGRYSRQPLGDAASGIFVFSNRSQRPTPRDLVLVLPGAAFAPTQMLNYLERSLPEDTEVAVVEYPYLSPDFKESSPQPGSDKIAASVASGLTRYRQEHHFDLTGVYASSLGGSILAAMLSAGVRFDFVVLDGIQESRPLPLVCRSQGWLRDVLPRFIGSLGHVILITNKRDLKERSRELRKLPTTQTVRVVELDAQHPWEGEDPTVRIPFLKSLFEGLLECSTSASDCSPSPMP